MSTITQHARDVSSSPAGASPPPADQNVAAFEAELPELLRSAAGRWVAFADGKRLRTAATQTELYRFCLNELRLSHDRFIVCHVAPRSGDVVDFPLR